MANEIWENVLPFCCCCLGAVYRPATTTAELRLLKLNFRLTQSCSIQNNIGVISSKFINKFVQKCHCYHALSDQNIPLVTVMSVVSLLTQQLWLAGI